eukprot:m51a1_g10411 putative endo- -beta-glucanase (469) ;mRNA; f:65802-67434
MKAQLLCVVAAIAAVASGRYVLSETWKGPSFWDHFDFANAPDPTHGYVYYTTRQEATNWGLISNNGDRSIIKSDSWSVAKGSGRGSVRIESKSVYNTGLFVLDLNHMPTGCATWPAFWMFGPNWPNSGEIDIIENVHKSTANMVTLHTKQGCDQAGQPTSAFQGHWSTATPQHAIADNCWVGAPDQYGNQGCSIVVPDNTYGAALNRRGGGVWAMQWTNEQIAVWYWPHGHVPGDLNANNPNPAAWGKPFAKFTLGSNCPSSFFQNLKIVINLTFCGDWAGDTFAQQCPAEMARWHSCSEFVKNDPAAFREAYWDINNIRIFRADGTPTPPGPGPRPQPGRLEGRVSLKSFFNTYVSAQDNGQVAVDRTVVQDWEIFTVEKSPVVAGAVVFRSFHGKYLSANPDTHAVVCDRPRPDAWESFYPEYKGNNHWLFKATNGRYLQTVDNPRILAASNAVPGGWETFTVERR